MKKPKRETAEQRARRIGRGLGFYLLKRDGEWRMVGGGVSIVATAVEVKLWRALARARGVKP